MPTKAKNANWDAVGFFLGSEGVGVGSGLDFLTKSNMCPFTFLLFLVDLWVNSSIDVSPVVL